MAVIEVNGIKIAYEIIGDGKQTAVITPGGRFSKDTPGIRQLAVALAAGGLRTLIWDRPNCGESDISFNGENESVMNADTLAALLRALNFGPTLVIGGSAGARVSLLSAIRHPKAADRLFLLWITGGALGLAMLAFTYCHNSMLAAALDGMDAVTTLPDWKEQLERNPRNRQILLSQEAPAFIEKMKVWGAAYIPAPNCAVPGITPADLANLKMPVMVLRSGHSDVHHARETSEVIHSLIPAAKIADPPWGDREWLDRLKAANSGEGLFARWPLLAPQILAFARS